MVQVPRAAAVPESVTDQAIGTTSPDVAVNGDVTTLASATGWPSCKVPAATPTLSAGWTW